MKPLFWAGSALQDLRAFPEDARRVAGHELHLVQQGLEPDDWKAIGDVGPGVYELRIRTAVEHRVFYVAKFAEGVYVLHAFQKKTQQIAQRDIELARERYRDALGNASERVGHPGGRAMDLKITPSSGNVFTELGFDEDEAEHLRLRSTLMIEVRKLIEDRNLTQTAAARLFGVTQPRISNLVRGRIDLFSIDTLVGMLARAGIHVDVVLSTAREGAA